MAPYPLAAPASVVPGGTSAEAHAVDRRQMSAQALPAFTAVFRQPQAAGGRAHGQALAAVIHRQAMAVDQVIGWRRGQPVVEHTEALTTVLRARDHEMPIDRYAALVLDRWYEPGGARSQRMYGHGEAETRRPGLDRLPGLPGICGAKTPVVVLQQQVVGVGRTAGHAMRFLDIRIVAPLGRHVIGAQAFTRAGPTGAAIAALPDPAAGHRHADVLAIMRIDTHRMDARPVVAATCPFGAFRTIPEWAVQCPAIAVIGGMEQSARKGARPEHAGFIGTAGFQRPYLLQAPGRRRRQIGASRCGHRFG